MILVGSFQLGTFYNSVISSLNKARKDSLHKELLLYTKAVVLCMQPTL